MSRRDPSPVLVAPKGTDPTLYSSISDPEFLSTATHPGYHRHEVDFPSYCEWMFNVEEGSIDWGTTAPVGGEVVDSFTFSRNIGDLLEGPPPYQYVDNNVITLPENPVWKVSDGIDPDINFPRLLLRAFFHRGKFYFLLASDSSEYPEGSSVQITVNTSKMEVVTKGTAGSGSGYVTRKTWKSTKQYY